MLVQVETYEWDTMAIGSRFPFDLLMESGSPSYSNQLFRFRRVTSITSGRGALSRTPASHIMR